MATVDELQRELLKIIKMAHLRAEDVERIATIREQIKKLDPDAALYLSLMQGEDKGDCRRVTDVGLWSIAYRKSLTERDLFSASRPRAHPFYELAREYYMECEAYDMKVCTGPVERDGRMPASPEELALVNMNAKRVLQSKLRLAGGDLGGLREAMSQYARSAQFDYDMREMNAKGSVK